MPRVYLSAFDLYRIGPGPSAIYTVGPQRAAMAFAHALAADGLLPSVDRVQVELFGGLAFHGRAHASGAAIVAGLAGLAPERCDAATLRRCEADAERDGLVALGGRHRIRLEPGRDIRYIVNLSLAQDGSAMRFHARGLDGESVAARVYFSVGGGAILADGEAPPPSRRVPYPFASASHLLDACRSYGKRIHDLARANECALASPGEVDARLAQVAASMRAAVTRGLAAEGSLPGGRARTAATWHRSAQAAGTPTERCTIFATAVGEENAAGGTIVTAPSAGAAGPVAALLHQWQASGAHEGRSRPGDFLLAGAAVGAILRQAGLVHVGCQGEIGVGAAMAAAGYAAVNNASNAQVLLAAERALAPHLGLACDLDHGLIEDPCIQRGALAAARAYDAATAALRVPEPRVGLDMVARSLLASGRGMGERHKSASIGGIAVNVVEC